MTISMVTRTRCNELNLKHKRFMLNHRKNALSVRIKKHLSERLQNLNSSHLYREEGRTTSATNYSGSVVTLNEHCF